MANGPIIRRLCTMGVQQKAMEADPHGLVW